MCNSVEPSSTQHTDPTHEVPADAGRVASLSVFDAALGLNGVQQLFQQGIAGVGGVTAIGKLMMMPYFCDDVVRHGENHAREPS